MLSVAIVGPLLTAPEGPLIAKTEAGSYPEEMDDPRRRLPRIPPSPSTDWVGWKMLADTFAARPSPNMFSHEGCYPN